MWGIYFISTDKVSLETASSSGGISSISKQNRTEQNRAEQSRTEQWQISNCYCMFKENKVRQHTICTKTKYYNYAVLSPCSTKFIGHE